MPWPSVARMRIGAGDRGEDEDDSSGEEEVGVDEGETVSLLTGWEGRW